MNELKVLGLVLELNPPHKGHDYFIKEAKRLVNPDITIAIISSSFSMRGDVMVLDKFTKTQVAMECGIDIVLELPYLATVSSADYFCFNAIKSLTELGITDLAFGVELDNIYKLQTLLTLTNSSSFNLKLKQYLDKGYSYSTSCNKSLGELTNDLDLINNYSLPNNTLGLQYLNALQKLNYECNITLVKRIENNFYDDTVTSSIASAQALRNKLTNYEDISELVINNSVNYIDINRTYDYLFKIIQYKFFTNNVSDFSNILGVSEGIENRIYNALLSSNNYSDLINKCITKRYTYNRIKRILLNIILDITNDNSNYVEYIRILGFNNYGESYINTLPSNTKKNIITTFKNKKNNVISIELRATNLYGILTDNSSLYLQEYTIPIRRNKK